MSKIKISTANGRKLNRHYIPSVVLTTSDVGSLQPVNIVECNPGDHVVVEYSQFTQTQPTAVRTFGSFNLKTYAFFVPIRTCWRHFEDWMVKTPDTSIDISSSPSFTLDRLLSELVGLSVSSSDGKWLLHNTVYGDLVSYSPSETADWSLEDADNNVHVDFAIYRSIPSGASGSEYVGFNFNSRGRLLMKILTGLGYEIPRRLHLRTDGTSVPILNQSFSFLPLLSFARIFYDWIYPSSYVQQQGFGSLFDLDSWESVSFSRLLSLFFVPMEQDFFTSLWLRPNEKALGSGSLDVGEHVFKDGVYNTGSLRGISSNESTLLEQVSSDKSLVLSSDSLRWLESISDFVVRNNIGGTRFHEWMKSHFGWVSSEQDSNRSVFLRRFYSSLSFSPVTASTGTDSQLLGQTAGNGVSNGGGKLKFEAKEHGYLIFMHMVTPVVAYYQGIKPWCKAVGSRFDFYTPELDAVGMEPVSRSEVFNSYESFSDGFYIPQSSYNNAFGFAPRYADRYKRGNSFLNGDFRLGSRNSDMQAYHTFRDVTYNRKNIALDAQFMQSDNQYNRVFAYPLTGNTGDSARDHLETLFTFDIVRYSTASSIGDSMPIFNRSGRDVSLDNGGISIL